MGTPFAATTRSGGSMMLALPGMVTMPPGCTLILLTMHDDPTQTPWPSAQVVDASSSQPVNSAFVSGGEADSGAPARWHEVMARPPRAHSASDNARVEFIQCRTVVGVY